MIKRIGKKVDKIGAELAKCKINGCHGVEKNLKKGIIPRCLYFEDRKNREGIIIIGINPGKAKKEEMDEIKKDAKNAYKLWKKYFCNDILKQRYYERLRIIAKKFTSGSILWTELVKCQNNKNGHPDIDVFRTCVHNYLNREMKLVPSEWPILAAGKKTYEAVSFLYPERTVIGVPHPTGFHGDSVGDVIKNLGKGKKITLGRAVWLGN